MASVTWTDQAPTPANAAETIVSSSTSATTSSTESSVPNASPHGITQVIVKTWSWALLLSSWMWQTLSIVCLFHVFIDQIIVSNHIRAQERSLEEIPAIAQYGEVFSLSARGLWIVLLSFTAATASLLICEWAMALCGRLQWRYYMMIQVVKMIIWFIVLYEFQEQVRASAENHQTAMTTAMMSGMAQISFAQASEYVVPPTFPRQTHWWTMMIVTLPFFLSIWVGLWRPRRIWDGEKESRAGPAPAQAHVTNTRSFRRPRSVSADYPYALATAMGVER